MSNQALITHMKAAECGSKFFSGNWDLDDVFDTWDEHAGRYDRRRFDMMARTVPNGVWVTISPRPEVARARRSALSALAAFFLFVGLVWALSFCLLPRGAEFGTPPATEQEKAHELIRQNGECK